MTQDGRHAVLLALVEQWRTEARENYGGCGTNTYVEKCADDLAALLCRGRPIRAGRGRGRRDVSEWQPIETAPKDGREVLLMGGEGSGRYKRTGYWARRTKAWSIDAVCSLAEPTHWAPLPDPLPSPPRGGQA